MRTPSAIVLRLAPAGPDREPTTPMRMTDFVPPPLVAVPAARPLPPDAVLPPLAPADDDELEKEFGKAIAYELVDDDIERARLLLGVDTASKQRELFSAATPDAIRNWAMGAGDDNPLYTDEDYGPSTRWGSQIAHGTMA